MMFTPDVRGPVDLGPLIWSTGCASPTPHDGGKWTHNPEEAPTYARADHPQTRRGQQAPRAGQGPRRVVRHLEIAESSWNRWRNQYGGMKTEDANKLKELKNTRLKQIVASQALDIDMLKELNREYF